MSLSEVDVLRIRAKYPSFMKVKKVAAKKPKVKKKKKLKEDNKCYHWCPIAKHDWFHEVTSSRLDEWEKPCPDCKKNI